MENKNTFFVYVKSTLMSILMAFLTGCQPQVLFEDPMPPNADVIVEIPEKFHGVYMCESDSTLIYVQKDLIYQEVKVEIEANINTLKENEDCSVVDQFIYFKPSEICVSFEYVSEELVKFYFFEIDSLFRFDDNQVAKLENDKLYLNIKSLEGSWVTFVISPNKDKTLTWEWIKIPADEKLIEELSQERFSRMTDDSLLLYIINPSATEFEEIKNRFKVDCDILVPVNLEREYF